MRDLKLDDYHLFNFENFAELEKQFRWILEKMAYGRFQCVNPTYSGSGAEN
jgi:hypothetical protein